MNAIAKDGRDTPVACAAWAAMLSDAAEDLLSAGEREALDGHVLTCAGCAWELADAQRGAAWLALLKGHVPEPPSHLLSAILSRTSRQEEAVGATTRELPVLGAAAGAVGHPQGEFPVWRESRIGSAQISDASGFRGRLERWLGLSGGFASSLQPRLAMTSAMAFFSICLTLNLLGVSVRDLHADSLGPAGIQRTVADTGASLVRSFEGIRMVYRVESRVNEFRTASSTGNDLPVEPHP